MTLKVEYVKEVVGKFYKVDMNSKDKKRSMARPRQIAMYLSRLYIGLSYSRIAHIIGCKDHTTVFHGCKTIKNLYKIDKAIQEDIDNISVMLEWKVHEDKRRECLII